MGARRIEVVITGDTKQFSRSLKTASSEAKVWGRDMAAVGAGAHHVALAMAGLAGAAGIGGVIATLKGASEAAARSQVVQQQMQQQLKASGESWAANRVEIEKTIAAQMRISAFDDEDLKQSFTTLERTTKDSGTALKLNALAADIARGKHIDLNTAAMLLGKVYSGNVSILARYGIQLKKGTDATTALGELQRRFGGQAEVFGKSNEGAAARMAVAWENAKEALGKGLLPTITKVSNAAADFFNSPRVQQALDRAGEAIGQKIGKAVEAVYNYLRQHRDDIANFARGVAQLATSAWRVLSSVAKVASEVAHDVGGWKPVLIGLVGAWATLRVATTTYFAVTRVQAMITAGTLKTALVSTGIGAVVVAAGLAAAYVISHWSQVREFFGRLAVFLKGAWGGALDVMKGALRVWAGEALTLLTLPIRGLLEGLSRLPFGMGKPFKAALEGLKSVTTDFIADGARQMAAGGARIGEAYGQAFSQTAGGYLQAVAKAQADIITNGQGYKFSGPSLAPNIAAGANRPGTSIKPGVLAFVGQLGGMVGERLTVGTGTNHTRYVAGTNRVSDHASGNAVDIPASGAELLKLGRMALIAAGMDSSEAIKQTGGLFNINGWQIIFNTNEGGNHYNHLHIGSHNTTVRMPTPGKVKVDNPYAGAGFGAAITGAAASTAAGKGKKPPVLPYGLQEAVDRAKATRGAGDDIKAYGRALAALRDELGQTDNAARRAQIQNKITSISRALEGIKDRAAAEKLRRIRDAFKQAFGPQITAALDAYDKATQRGLRALQDRLQSTLDGIDADLRRAQSSIDAQLRAANDALDARGKALTPEEQALESFKASRKAQEDAEREAELRAALAAAQTAEEKKQAQKDLDGFLLDRQEETLQASAAASRQALNDELDLERRAAQDKADADKQAAQDGAEARKRAAQDAYDAAVQAYNDERDAQRTILEQQLKDYEGYLVARGESAKQARIDLNNWLAAHPEYGVAESDLPASSAASSAASISNAALAAAAAVGAQIFSGGGRSVYKAAGGRLIPMADGGTFTVRRPTFLPILAGEAGHEDVSFTPLRAGRRSEGVVITINDNGVHLERNTETARRIAKAVEPFIGTTPKVST